MELAEGYQKLCARYEAAMRDQDGAMELQAERNKSLEEQQREALDAVFRLEEQLKGRREAGGAAALQRAEATNLALTTALAALSLVARPVRSGPLLVLGAPL